jgi:hypothetical protein
VSFVLSELCGHCYSLEDDTTVTQRRLQKAVVWSGIEVSIRPSGNNFINQEMDVKEDDDRTVQYSTVQ